jgi:hypothetical protein
LSVQDLAAKTYSVAWPVNNGKKLKVEKDAGLNLQLPPQSAIILIAGSKSK